MQIFPRTKFPPSCVSTIPLPSHHAEVAYVQRLTTRSVFPPRSTSGDDATNEPGTTSISQIWYHCGYFLCEDRFLGFGRLSKEYAVGVFSRAQESQLRYIADHQKCLRREEAELMGNDYDLPEHDNGFLPVSSLGGRRWRSNQTSDTICLARWGVSPLSLSPSHATQSGRRYRDSSP